jgi:hypothetical protein
LGGLVMSLGAPMQIIIPNKKVFFNNAPELFITTSYLYF